MTHITKVGTILVRTDAIVPGVVDIHSEPYAPGWSLVTNFDGYGLGRLIHAAGWTFFWIAGEARAIALGSDGEKALPKAISRIIAKHKSEFNSLEITRVEYKSFFGIFPYISVSAVSRHIQESIFLVPVMGLYRGQQRGWSRARAHTLWEEATSLPGAAVTLIPQWSGGVSK
jgi:hypothetical protein